MNPIQAVKAIESEEERTNLKSSYAKLGFTTKQVIEQDGITFRFATNVKKLNNGCFNKSLCLINQITSKEKTIDRLQHKLLLRTLAKVPTV